MRVRGAEDGAQNSLTFFLAVPFLCLKAPCSPPAESPAIQDSFFAPDRHKASEDKRTQPFNTMISSHAFALSVVVFAIAHAFQLAACAGPSASPGPGMIYSTSAGDVLVRPSNTTHGCLSRSVPAICVVGSNPTQDNAPAALRIGIDAHGVAQFTTADRRDPNINNNTLTALETKLLTAESALNATKEKLAATEAELNSTRAVLSSTLATIDALRLRVNAQAQVIGGVTVIKTDSEGRQGGGFMSMQLDDKEYPVAAHFDDNFEDLVFTRCLDASCKNAETHTVDASSTVVGKACSLALDFLSSSSPLPMISYFDDTNDKLKFARCLDPSCSSVEPQVVLGPCTNNAFHTSITLRNGTLPVISYSATNSRSLDIVLCHDASCSSAVQAPTKKTLDSSTDVKTSNIRLRRGSDQQPVVVYSASGGHLKIAMCKDTECSAAPDIVTLDSTHSAVFPSVDFDAAGRPYVAYQDYRAPDDASLWLAKCDDPWCKTPPQLLALDEGLGNTGRFVLF